MSRASQAANTGEYGLETAPRRFLRWLRFSSWGSSVGIHVVILLMLGMLHFEVKQHLTTLIDSVVDDVDPADYKFDATVSDQIGTEGSFETLSASQAAVASVVNKAPQEELQNNVDETLNVQVPATQELLKAPAKTEMLAAVQTSGGTEQVGGVEGAIDRMAFEIANTLREKKTLVVWLFDVSPSLHVRRAKIADRVENVYNQLNAMNVGADKALKSAVAVFGEKMTVLTNEPLDDTTEVVKTVRSIKSEDSGKENVFDAVDKAAHKWLSHRTKMGRAMMIVVVTDEAGSDPQKVDEAIKTTKRNGIKCYVIGDGAPLGRRQIESEFTLENGETVIGVMDRGPETFYQERLRLGYWGGNGWELDNISSGFGPYALTRLCAETNGLFLVSEPGDRFKIDPISMRSYPPDYRPIAQIDADIQKNLAKRAVIEVCEQYKIGAENIPIPTTFFPAESDTVLRTVVTEAQKPLAELDYRLDAILKKLEAGEKDREKLKEPRWRAVYDLALGRVLAMRVRSFGYNMMLAEMRGSPKKFEKPGSNAWRLVPAKDITSGATTKKMATKAHEYLRRVIDEHAGTPWAILAEAEYNTPLGWEWKEATYNPQPQNMSNDDRDKKPKFVEETDPKTGKKTKRMLPAEPQRREI